MTADGGLCLRRGRAVDVAVLSEYIVITHFKEGGLAFVLEVLRLQTDNGEWEKLVALAEGGGPSDYYVTVQYAAGAEFYMRTDYAVRPYGDIVR